LKTNPRIYAGIFLTSMSVLTLELALTRVFSATMYYHFAFLAISVALFGAGASGVAVFLLDERLRRRPTEVLLAVFTLAFAAGVVVALVAVLTNPLSTSPGKSNFWSIALIYVSTAIPFVFAGCAITLAITRYASDASRVYLFDLAGAAAGCLLLIPLLNLLGGVNGILFIAVLAAVSAIVFSIGSKRLTIMSAVAAAALSIFLAVNLQTGMLAIRWAKGLKTTDEIFSKWNSFSHITVTGDLRQSSLQILIDADACTYVMRNAGLGRALPDPPVTAGGLVYRLKRNSEVLIIGPGGGNDVLTARLSGQKRITAVEVNGIIARDVMQREPIRSYSGDLYGQPDVRVVIDEGRSFISNSHARYDIIEATMVDTWAATAAGAFSLAENNLYTVEAFKDYIRHLTPDGILSMTRWYYEPPDQLMRLITITRQAMTELEAEDHSGIFKRPGRHFILVKFGKDEQRLPATFLFKQSEFTDAEIAEVERLAAVKGFTVLYTPRTQPDPRYASIITADDITPVVESWVSNISPTRDDNPFFFNTLRLSHIGDALVGTEEWRKTNLGTYILFSLLPISAVLVVAFIIGPLLVSGVRARTASRGRLAFLLYFAGLGLGFILIEIAMIQKFILFLGHPVYALAVVLFSILCFCGIGSAITRRFRQETLPDTLAKVLGAVAALVVIYVLVLSPLFYRLVHLPEAARIALAVVLLAPLAMAMGMPMPIGIRIAADRAPQLIPWAWGLNGAASVLGSVAALAGAILTGFNHVLLVGAATYLVTLLCAMRFRAPEPVSA
jgi:hypothetical protein